MTARTLRRTLATVAAAGLFALTGCGTITISTDDASASPTPTSASAAKQPSSAATTETGTAAGDGETPNPCKLLTPADVNSLTKKEITQIDRSNSEAGSTRYCQWQLEAGVLAVFLSPSSPGDFDVRDPAAQDYDGVGDKAFTAGGHLYVLKGNLQIDVYATSGGNDAENLAVEKAVAEKVISQL
ncbi:DUF3558 family protein [Cryptosporangium phraense]|uniref:DUF3558 domain-containing protein n=1 Tax=Cryptosporangium phraense TaxID=2593070 RepID=A0A545AG40_9ACTN|nr:DUF3558 family protein [Cryptosporangium phraense]TQS40230.1 DUF3558 domain-containing protein [Cryptosporangium phraense]